MPMRLPATLARKIALSVAQVGALLSLLAATPAHAQTQPRLYLNEIANGLSSPLYLTAPANDPRLFIVEQTGRVRIVQGGVLLPQPFLNLVGRITSGGERGLLSIAFHPNYAANGYIYVNYTDGPGSTAGDTVIERYTVSATNPNLIDVTSRKRLLVVDQPYENHNGGLIKFGPDGKLYIGMGDGGSGGDPENHAQNRRDLLGDMLRIDVDSGDPYGIPADNPFVGQTGVKGEIWAYGLRNPWRWSFDTETNHLYIGDVGQGEWEEVHISPANTGGQNYGWKIMEGNHCFSPATGCNQTGLVKPQVEYSHSEGCSIAGGYVYRGSRIPEIVGHYFYSDFCSGWVRSFKYANNAVTDKRQWTLPNVGNILSFGQDSAKNMYVLSQNGRVYRLAKQDNLRGDLTRDETVDVGDATVLLQIAINAVTPTAIQRTLSDVNRDTKTDVNDAVMILQYAVGLIPSLP